MIIKENREELLSYLEDASSFKGEADTVFIPEDKGEVREILREAYTKKIPITCSGARTGTTGGCVPLEGAILSLERLRRLKEIDTKTKMARVEAGLNFQDLETESNKFGLSFKASPTETLAFIGGSVATSASGVRGFRYGSIRNYIKRIEVILADGRSLNIKRGQTFSKKREFCFTLNGMDFSFSLPRYNLPRVKTQAGYFVKDDMDLIDLFIGSEGTLGVIVEVDLELKPLSREVFNGVVFFERELDCLNFVEDVKRLKREGRLSPTSLEFFDLNSIEFLRKDYPNIPSCNSALYFEEEVEDDLEDVVSLFIETIESNGASLDNVWFAKTEKDRMVLYGFRYRLPQLINEYMREYKQTKLSSDIAVPSQNFREMYKFYKEEARDCGVYFVIFGHIGEDHLHLNLLPRDDEEYRRARETLLRFIKKAIMLGGTISAEHGIGKIKRPYLEMMYGIRHLKEMASLKRYFDKDYILGRGNLFESSLLMSSI